MCDLNLGFVLLVVKSVLRGAVEADLLGLERKFQWPEECLGLDLGLESICDRKTVAHLNRKLTGMTQGSDFESEQRIV